MRDLVLFMHMSLDGYVAAADKESALTTGEDDGAFDAVVPQLTDNADTLLLGRVVADELLGYWLNAEANEPNLSSGAIAYARWATHAHKAVLSNAEEQLPWEGSEMLLVRSDQDIVRAVSALKRQPGKNVVVHGGVRTAQGLTRLNLIDEYQLIVHPVLVGDGGPLFKGLPARVELKRVAMIELRAGAVFLRYRPETPEVVHPTT